MKIADIKVFVVGNPWKNWVLVKVETDEGQSGWGDATTGLSSTPVTAALGEIRRLCVGMDADRIELLWDTVFKALYLPSNEILLSAMSGVTTACWDIVAQLVSAPLYKLFGGRTNERIKAYPHGWYTGPRDPGFLREREAQVVGMGYRALKFDPFGSNYRRLDTSERPFSDTVTGSVTVNTEPFPASLVTVMSPPMSWQNLRLMASPSPVPPYFLLVELSACSKAWKSLPSCSGVVPMPESVTRKVISEQ